MFEIDGYFTGFSDIKKFKNKWKKKSQFHNDEYVKYSFDIRIVMNICLLVKMNN